MLTKNTIINISVWLWMVLSVSYIGYDLFSKFTVNVMQKSYIAWQTDTVNSLITEAKKWCEWFKVYNKDNEVTLINVDCLKSPSSSQVENQQKNDTKAPN